MKIIFACKNCKEKAIQEYKKTHKIGWTKTHIKELEDFSSSSFMKEANEVELTKGSDYIEGADGSDAWILTCSDCRTKTRFDRGFGNL